MLRFNIQPADVDCLEEFREFCQVSYQQTYARPDLGVPAEFFSTEVFAGPGMDRYFKDIVRNDDTHGCWVAREPGGQVLGTVAVVRTGAGCELKAFYVALRAQHQGLGKELFRLVLDFAAGQPIGADVVEYMTGTIAMYKRWGFEIDVPAGIVRYEFDGWPAGFTAAYQGIRMVLPQRGEIEDDKCGRG